MGRNNALAGSGGIVSGSNNILDGNLAVRLVERECLTTELKPLLPMGRIQRVPGAVVDDCGHSMRRSCTNAVVAGGFPQRCHWFVSADIGGVNIASLSSARLLLAATKRRQWLWLCCFLSGINVASGH
jgi:hypothetical protein